MKVAGFCPFCKAGLEVDAASPLCPSCKKNIFPDATDSFHATGELVQCPLCGCTHLYRQKDFNRNLGLALLVVGVALAYWTYGISLLVVTVIDFLLFRMVRECGCCYQCFAVFRESPAIEKLEPFNLILHDHYKNRRNQ